MSRRQQPDRVRILSSGSSAAVGARRRDDAVLATLQFEDEPEDVIEIAPVPLPPRSTAPAPRWRMVGLFLCSSALGGACAVASGLLGVAGR